MKKYAILFLINILFISSLFAADRPKIVVTTSIIKDITQQIAGDLVEVESLVPTGGDPHLYEPIPQDAIKIVKANLILMNGWNKKYPDNWANWNKNPNFKYFDRDETYSSLNTIMRCSKRLINKIMEFKNNHNKLIFHEILLYSLAKQNNFSVLNYKSKDVFNSAFDNRKKKSIKEKYDEAIQLYLIKHPIKYWWKYA